MRVPRQIHRILVKLDLQPKEHKRVLRRYVREVLARVPAPICIETGCIRNPRDKTNSTLTIARTLEGHGTFYTFEYEPRHIEVCRQVCGAWNDHITYVECDSVSNLTRLVGDGTLAKIDFAFLDAANDAEHTWREFSAIEGSLAAGSVLVVDDVLRAEKGRKVLPYLRERPEWELTIYDCENGLLAARRLA
jgi:predicted O-methyltransferase YrrM